MAKKSSFLEGVQGWSYHFRTGDLKVSCTSRTEAFIVQGDWDDCLGAEGEVIKVKERTIDYIFNIILPNHAGNVTRSSCSRNVIESDGRSYDRVRVSGSIDMNQISLSPIIETP